MGGAQSHRRPNYSSDFIAIAFIMVWIVFCHPFSGAFHKSHLSNEME